MKQSQLNKKEEISEIMRRFAQKRWENHRKLSPEERQERQRKASLDYYYRKKKQKVSDKLK